MLSLEVVGPGDGLSMVPSQAVAATAAHSCDRTVAAPLSSAGGRLAEATARWHRPSTAMGSRFGLIRLVSFIRISIFGLFIVYIGS